MEAVVPAAGKGTRMGPLTDDRPKALVRVDGIPLIEHALAAAARLEVESIVLVVGHRSDELIAHVGDTFEDLPITYVHQPDPRGLADAVFRARAHVSGPFVVINGDNVLATDLTRVIDPVDAGADAAVLVDRVPRDRARETGVVVRDGDRVHRVVEKPDEPPSQWITTGCYVLPEAVFHACSLIEPSPTGEYELTAALDLLCRAGHEVRAVELEGRRWNVNTPEDIRAAERYLTSTST